MDNYIKSTKRSNSQTESTVLLSEFKKIASSFGGALPLTPFPDQRLCFWTPLGA